MTDLTVFVLKLSTLNLFKDFLQTKLFAILRKAFYSHMVFFF